MPSNGAGITGWIVQTARGIQGPFANAGDAGAYIETHHQSLAAPFSVLPMHEPRHLAGESVKDAIRWRVRVPFDDGWAQSAT